MGGPERWRGRRAAGAVRRGRRRTRPRSPGSASSSRTRGSTRWPKYWNSSCSSRSSPRAVNSPLNQPLTPLTARRPFAPSRRSSRVRWACENSCCGNSGTPNTRGRNGPGIRDRRAPAPATARRACGAGVTRRNRGIRPAQAAGQQEALETRARSTWRRRVRSSRIVMSSIVAAAGEDGQGKPDRSRIADHRIPCTCDGETLEQARTHSHSAECEESSSNTSRRSPVAVRCGTRPKNSTCHSPR